MQSTRSLRVALPTLLVTALWLLGIVGAGCGGRKQAQTLPAPTTSGDISATGAATAGEVQAVTARPARTGPDGGPP
jgi:hypothetical protein